jgi:SNF2 family DNA or RNA helicase
MLVVDESSRIKTPGAKRTKMITKFAKHAKYRRIMTGTPVTKGPEDVYTQFKFLDPNILGYESFYSFRARYCVMGGFENRQIVSYQNTEELINSIEGSSYRVLKKDCLDLPSKIYQRHYVELSPKQRKVYNEMKKNFITELDSKVIIWARFKADLRAIQGMLGDSAVAYHGDVTNDLREVAVQRFQNDPKIKYFIGQPQSGGIGLTLTAAHYAIYYSNSFDLETRLQSEDRCHRIGTTKNVTYIDLESPKTIDTKIIRALRDKKNLADYINKDPVSLFLTEEEE